MEQEKKELKKKKKISISTIIIIILLLIIIAIVVNKISNPDKSQELFGYKFYTVLSGSMEPEINIGDVVIVKQNENLNKGDIIAFHNQGIITVHRINDIVENDGETSYKTKGDSNNAEDPEMVKRADIEGSCVAIIPFVGKIAIFIYNNLILCCLTVVIITIIILLFKYLR